MASSNLVPPTTKMQQLIKSDRRMFSASDDSAMMKQIQATHSPDGREVDVNPILYVIEDILQRADEHADGLEDKTGVPGFDGIIEALAYIINKISCELSCKCSGGADAHGTTMAILNMLSSYSWDAKVVISLAAFAVNLGDFWLVAYLCTTNPLAKNLSLLKQLPDIIEHAGLLKSRFDTINNLVMAILNVTKCIVQFKELPLQYISPETAPMSTAMAHVPTAVYWTIRSMVACASQITSLLGMSYEHLTSTTEAWELSGLAHKVGTIHDHLKHQLSLCYQHIDEKRHAEAYQMLVRLFEMTHMDNIRILKALICSKDDIMPLLDDSEEIKILGQYHHETRTRSELHYEIVWLPILDTSMPWNQANQEEFEQLQLKMPWYKVVHPSLIEPAVIKYIKEVWHFSKKLILVTLDPLGKVVSPNAIHMVMIWGNRAYPFTTVKEESLWKEETWSLELLVDGIDSEIQGWVNTLYLSILPGRLCLS